MPTQSFNKLAAALTIYIVSLLAANTLGLKLMPFLFGTHLSVSVFFFPFVFLTTDVIGQVYGRQMAKAFVWAGFLSIVVFMAYSLLSAWLPWSDAAAWAEDGYRAIFGVSLRVSLASLLAFVIAEYQDVVAFFFFKEKAGDRLWLQSNLSNLWSQFLDTTIFMFVAFAGIYPIRTILLMALPWWLYKVAAGALYTPLSYLGVRMLRYKEDQNL